MLPYDGITRTGSKGVSHFVTKTPSEGRKVLESKGKGKLNGRDNPLSERGLLAILRPRSKGALNKSVRPELVEGRKSTT